MALSRRSLLLAPFAPAESLSLETIFRRILDGYLTNSRRTSSSWAVCNFADGTILPGAVNPKGNTYDSVSRMLPALAAWSVRTGEHADTLISILRHAFDPAHPDYWGASPTDAQQQRQVEASVVAWALWVARDLVLPQLSPAERANIQNWLASCTVRPVRTNNWAWFTAVNQAVRLDLSHRWPEFKGDSAWMLEDLRFLDSLAGPGSDGWYTDSPKEPTYDFYNFWVFASHFLYWNKVAGRDHPVWSAKFTLRLKQLLETAPSLFGANGSHVLFGRSLIYRWAAVTPLVLAYEQGLWPHSAGLLRRIVRGNIEYFWKIGAFDSERGKLRETLTPGGSRAVCEPYIDNGHPYWGMQAFAIWLLPPDRAFWTAAEEQLPVEKHSFVEPLRGPKILLAGDRPSGEVRWMIAANGHNQPEYEAKYTKFSYSTHSPWGTEFDNALQFRTPGGVLTGQAGIDRAYLRDDGYERTWWARAGNERVTVTTTFSLSKGVETRKHVITAPPGIEFVEGSRAFASEPRKSHVKAIRGYENVAVEVSAGTNIVHPRTWIIALRGRTAPGGTTTLESRFD